MVKAAGTPTPEVLWFKNELPVQIQPGHIGIFNDGTELRISGVRNDDIGDYTCIARNGEGRIHHTTKLVKAGKILCFINLLGPNGRYERVMQVYQFVLSLISME